MHFETKYFSILSDVATMKDWLFSLVVGFFSWAPYSFLPQSNSESATRLDPTRVHHSIKINCQKSITVEQIRLE